MDAAGPMDPVYVVSQWSVVHCRRRRRRRRRFLLCEGAADLILFSPLSFFK